MKKKILLVTGIIIIICLSVLYINKRYFFNPMAFNKDRITSHEWSDYQRPLTMTYVDFEGKRKTYTIEDEDKIRDVIQELKKCTDLDKESGSTGEVKGGLTLKSQNKNHLLDVLIYSNHWEVLKKGSQKYYLSSSLKQFVSNY